MCGIAGILNKADLQLPEARIAHMTHAIAHRGPDGEGFWMDKSVGLALGHRRLSVIDLSAHAAQPMHWRERYVLVFNGEIYNYLELRAALQQGGETFTSTSDTEVLLALYHKLGPECLHELDGMFAFAIYDRLSQNLFCARDRFGEKPFYYAYTPGQSFYFASEPKALFAGGVPRSLSEVHMFNYLAHGFNYQPGDPTTTFYKGVLALAPGHCLLLNAQNATVTRHWQYYAIDHTIQDNALQPQEGVEQITQLFTEGLRRRCRADVPVGAALSGGLDSSIVLSSLLGEPQMAGIKVFSARFPGFAKDESRYMDQMLAQSPSFIPQPVFPTAEGFARSVAVLCYHQEEPLGSTSGYAEFAMMEAVKAAGVTVMFDGQGADEYAAGYRSFYRQFFAEMRAGSPGQFATQFRQFTQSQGYGLVCKGRAYMNYVLKAKVGRSGLAARRLKVQWSHRLGNWLAPDFFSAQYPGTFEAYPQFSSLNEALHFATFGGMLGENLRCADRNSMAHGCESRMPFLYHKLVEAMFRLPADLKMREGWTKWPLRQGFSKVLPAEIAWRRDKIGFEAPAYNLLSKGPVRDLIERNADRLKSLGMVKKSLDTNKLQYQQAWRLLNVGGLFGNT